MSNPISLNLTGLDTDTIIKNLMAVEQQPLLKLQNQQSTLLTRKSAWDAIKSEMSNLKSKLSALLDVGGFDGKSVTISNPNAVSATAVASASPATYEIEISSLAAAQVVQSSSFSTATDALGISGTLTLNGQSIIVDGTDSLQAIAGKINGASGVNATAVVLQTGTSSWRLVLTSSISGVSGKMDFGTDTTVWQSLGVVSAATGLPNEVRAAKDASFTINGVQFTRTTNTVSDAVSGVTLNLLSAVDGTPQGGKASLTVGYDDQAVIAKVKDLVNEYNAVLDAVGKYNTWDADAKKGGPLFGDSLVTGLLSDLNSAVFSGVAGLTGPYSTMGSVGISTGAIGSLSRDGHLTLDETKLSQALKDDRNAVAILFGVQGSDPSQGMLNRLKSAVDKYASAGGLIDNRSQALSDQDKDLSEQIQDMQAQLDAKEASLRKQYTDLEVTLQRLNSQSAWLTQQLNSMSVK